MYTTIADYLRHASPPSVGMEPPKLVRSYSTYGIPNFSPKVMHGLRILKKQIQPTPEEREALKRLSEEMDRLFLDLFPKKSESDAEYLARFPHAMKAFGDVYADRLFLECFRKEEESQEEYQARYPHAVQAFSSLSVSTSLMVC